MVMLHSPSTRGTPSSVCCVCRTHGGSCSGDGDRFPVARTTPTTSTPHCTWLHRGSPVLGPVHIEGKTLPQQKDHHPLYGYTCFIAMVWNRACRVAEARLYRTVFPSGVSLFLHCFSSPSCARPFLRLWYLKSESLCLLHGHLSPCRLYKSFNIGGHQAHVYLCGGGGLNGLPVGLLIAADPTSSGLC